MERPKAYGPFHLIFVAVGVIVSVLLARYFRNANDRTHKAILLSVGIFLGVCEVYKQLFYFFYMNDHQYPLWIFPFQLCSVPMYLCLVTPFLKPGKVQKSLLSFMMLYNLLGGAISFTEPSGLLHGYWTLTLHACIWHMLLVFLGLYLVFSGRGGYEMADYKRCTVVFLTLCLIAFGVNLLAQSLGGDLNLFYVGPGNSPIFVFKQISEFAGWWVSTLLYVPVICLGSYLIFLPIRLYHKRKALVTA